MTTYMGRGGLATVLSIKLMKVFYLSRVRQGFSILRSQVDASRAVDLGYSEASLPTGGDLVGTLLSEHPSEH
jgi:hypothetical protein